MRKAVVRIKAKHGDFSNKKYIFWTDIKNLKKGDLVTVQTRYGLQIALFYEYSEDCFLPENFVIDKISGERFEERIKEQKDKLIRDVLDGTHDLIKYISRL